MRRKSVLLLIFVLFVLTFLFADIEKIDPENYFVRKWTVGDGLPHGNIQTAIFDRENYLWLGTDRGLVRFDGSNFERYPMKHLQQNPYPMITALYESHDGTLWLGTHGDGLISFSKNKFLSHQENNTNSLKYVTAIDGIPGGKLWVGTRDQGLVVYHPQSKKFFSTSSLIGNKNITALSCEIDGSGWIGTMNGLYHYKNDKIFFYSKSHGLSDNHITSITKKPGGRIWVGTIFGLSYAVMGENSDNNNIIFESVTSVGEKYVHFLKIDHSENLWISLPEGLWAINVKKRRMVGPGINVSVLFRLKNSPISFFCQNRDRTLWFSTANDGLIQMGEKIGRMIGLKNGLSSYQVTSICEGSDGSIWVGTSDNGLNRISQQGVKKFSHAEGLLSHSVYSLYNDRHGNIWVGTDRGFCLFKDDKFQQDPQWETAIKHPVTCFILTRKGEFWIGTMGDGLFLFREGKFSPIDVKRGLHSNDIQCLAEDINGDLMVGTSSGLNLVQNGIVHNFIEEETFIGKSIRDVFMEKDATLWVGTQDHGLFLFRNTIQLNPQWKQYFEGETIFNLSSNGKRQVMINSSIGIFYLNKKESYTQDRWRTSERTFYNMAAVYSKKNAYPGNSGSVFFRQQSGELWISTNDGLYILTEEERMSGMMSQPKIKLEKIGTGSDLINYQSNLRLDGDVIGIEFSVPNYNPLKNHIFRYKLNSLDNSWWLREGILPKEKRRMDFYDLPSGPFQLQIIGGYIFSNPTNSHIETFSFSVKSNWMAYPVIFLLALVMAMGVFFMLRRDKSQRELNLFFRTGGGDPCMPIPSREIRKHATKLLRFMREHKPYLDPNLTLASLSMALNISKETLSQVVNRELCLNFNAFLNQYRVEEAKGLLKDPEQNKFVILKIAYDVGFNSKSSFNAAFRQLTGKTPTQYRKKHQS